MKYSWNISQGAFREAIEDFDFNGFSIPKGWKFNTQKSRVLPPEPEKFDPRRFEGNEPAPYTYVPFVKRFKCQTVIPNGNITYNPTPIPAKGLPVRLIPQRS
ncbi:hypothetical protein GYH30_051196 [Glycine max]|nr:hypothetical protein GYH30_051196 [Glycine max]